MIDHVLGRPSVQFRKIQVLAVVSFWSLYLLRGNKNGPPFIRALSRRLSPRLTAWQQLVVTLLWLYIARNFGKLVGLECPEPLANLYSRSYFRATWVTTALDAGFWSAMRIRQKWIRDLASVIFSVYYLFAAEQADDKVRKIRSTLTVDHVRVSWNKSTTPYLDLLGRILRPRLARYPPRAIRIPRPAESSYKDPVAGWLYFDGPLSALQQHTKMILDVPGGGYVAMSPRNHEDKLLAWAGKTGLPVLSLDYRKAPEYPYPYALNECYDVYHTLIATKGRCIGLSGETQPRIVVSGDSAGGNLAAGMVLMIIQSADAVSHGGRGAESLPVPEGLVLMYPSLDMNIGNWMTDEQMSLIKDRRMRKTNRNVLRRKSEVYNKLAPGTPHHSDDEEDATPPQRAVENTALNVAQAPPTLATLPPPALPPPTTSAPQRVKTRLATSSMISYFNDRILTPEMMRAMIILYVGPYNRPDFSTDYLLCPLLAPEGLLSRFPKTCFLTGERDPLVDDTVIFAGRLRQAHYTRWRERRELGLPPEGYSRRGHSFEERDHVEVLLIPGISHGFLQFVGVFPEGWRYIFRCARWAEELFARDTGAAAASARRRTAQSSAPLATPGTESSGDEDRPLEMSMISSSTGSAANGQAGGHASQRYKRRGHSHGRPNGTRRKEGEENEEDEEEEEEEEEDDDSHREKSSGSLTSGAKENGGRGRGRGEGGGGGATSEDDLLGRRMKGLAGGLMGMSTVHPADEEDR
ncbi:MAG: hypothetical protein M1838_000755 [Thelocarpon superellum]|nr:MAG: hypothetical protein M1838_000755 [Thelocarpon superellum]